MVPTADAARWFFSIVVKGAGGGPTLHAFEIREPVGGTDLYLRLSFDWTTKQVTKTNGASTIYGVTDLGNGRYRLWGAIDKPAGRTRLLMEFVKSLPAGQDVKLAEPMLVDFSGLTPPTFVHGPTT